MIPTIVSDYYSPAVQQMFSKFSMVSATIFGKLASTKKSPTLRDVLNYFLSLRTVSDDFLSPCISPSCTLATLLSITCETFENDVRLMFEIM